ncbi:MAG TPA: MFS transporter [Steroidobacteraceae bacterium]|nr:MFS transporter [Steroidobacteraceae bacterium]
MANPLAALRYRDFTVYAAARFCSTLAWEMLSVAVGWQVYQLTRNPLDLGLIGLAQFLPFVLLVLPAGHVADRADRRLVLWSAYAVQAVCAGTLLWFALAGARVLWPVFLAMTLFGGARAFSMPTAQAMTPNLVPAEAFPSAVAFNSLLLEISVITGPSLGGLLFLAGPTVVYGVGFTLALLVVVLVSTIRPVHVRSGPEEPISADLLGGLRFVLHRPTVLGAISLDLFAVLFGGAVALLPAYASDILHVGPAGLGLLRTAPGTGAALTAITVAFVPIERNVGKWMFGGVALYGLATVVFGMSQTFWISLLALVVVGGSDMVSVYIRHLLVQLETPDAIRGRVSAVSSMFIGASNELGEFESGVTARWFGLVRAVVLGGLATLVVVAVYTRLFPELRRMDRFRRRE